MVIHKTFADFVLFLYVHMAWSDGVYHPTEAQVILDKIPKLFPSESDPEQKLADAEKEYASTDKSKIATIIRATFKHFKEVKFTLKYKIYTDMYDIVHADGKVDAAEQAALHELKEIIEVGAGKD
jgi:uncharacterized tellurite resistance protein B-like protein